MIWTEYPSLLDTQTYLIRRGSFADFAGWLGCSPPRDTPKSPADPAFGPYELVGAGRGNDAVALVQAAVFDVDLEVTEAKLAACRERLAGVEHLWYPSASWTPAVPRARLVVSLLHPIHAPNWRSSRAELIESFAIPADVKSSASVSHSYFTPARGGVVLRSGAPLYVESWPSTQAPRAKLPSDWEPPYDANPVDLTPFYERLRKRATASANRGEPRGKWLAALVAGEPWAPDGQRHPVLVSLSLMLANMFPGAGVNTLARLFEPSQRALAAAGSKITMGEVHRALTSAVARVARDLLQTQSALDAFKGW